jgi:hypothetical protein
MSFERIERSKYSKEFSGVVRASVLQCRTSIILIIRWPAALVSANRVDVECGIGDDVGKVRIMPGEAYAANDNTDVSRKLQISAKRLPGCALTSQPNAPCEFAMDGDALVVTLPPTFMKQS